jgi:hypothetical protein
MHEKNNEFAKSLTFDQIISKYTERADYFYRQFHDDSYDSDISGAIWAQKETEARRMFDLYCEVLNDLNAIK